MNFHRIFPSTIVLGALLTLTACGGGSSSSSTIDNTQIQSYATPFTTKFNAGLSAIGTSSGLTSMSVADAFDAGYLDMGFTKTNLLSSLSDTSQSLGTNPELSLFPMAQVTNVTLTGCDTNNVCTMNGTLTNSDVDTTSVDFSTKVKFVSGAVYLYGDQSSTSSI